jgi:hypothetical protein
MTGEILLVGSVPLDTVEQVLGISKALIFSVMPLYWPILMTRCQSGGNHVLTRMRLGNLEPGVAIRHFGINRARDVQINSYYAD